MKKINLIISILLLFTACSKENDNHPKVYTFNKENATENLPANWGKSIDIKLETSDSVVITENNKMLMTENDIYIYTNNQPIYHFDRNGKYINKFGNVGHAKNEYIEINDIFLNTSSKELELLTPRKIIHYDYDGNFKSLQKLQIGFISFIHNKDEYWFSTGANTFDTEYEVLKTDNKLNIKKKFLNRGFKIPCNIPNFPKCPIKVYTYLFSNDIYHIDTEKDTVTHAYTFKFPGMEIPDIYQHGTMEELIDKYPNDELLEFAEKYCYLESEQYIYLLIGEYKNKGKNYYAYHWIINKKNGKEIVIKIGDINNIMVTYQSNPQLLDENNILYFLGTDKKEYKDESVHVIGIDLNKLFK
ncbi:MAG: 6-bladed beta-propeller [Bacteroidaceae bacterium]|nr:6-bladed beta-propeller [Bacteroidaceae bacterium]